METVVYVCIANNKNWICRDRTACIIFGCYNKKIHEQIKEYTMQRVPYPNTETIGE